MIKLTNFGIETNVFVNPYNISFLSDRDEGGCRVYINDGDSSCLLVQESAEEIIEKINIMKLSESAVIESAKELRKAEISSEEYKMLLEKCAKALIP